MIKQIQIRRGTAAALSSENEILADGELCYDQTNGIVKVGDGVTAWDDLDVFLGVDGAPGASAFEVAVEEGFVGDVNAWMASLQGEAGEDGAGGTVPQVVANGGVLTDEDNVGQIINVFDLLLKDLDDRVTALEP